MRCKFGSFFYLPHDTLTVSKLLNGKFPPTSHMHTPRKTAMDPANLIVWKRRTLFANAGIFFRYSCQCWERQLPPPQSAHPNFFACTKHLLSRRKAETYFHIAKSIDDSLPVYSRQAEQGTLGHRGKVR